MTILEVVDSSALLEMHQTLSKINLHLLAQIFDRLKKKPHPLFLHKCLTFAHSLVKLHFLWCTPGEQSTTATGKVFENTTGGGSRSHNHYFCMERFIPNTNTGGS